MCAAVPVLPDKTNDVRKRLERSKVCEVENCRKKWFCLETFRVNEVDVPLKKWYRLKKFIVHDVPVLHDVPDRHIIMRQEIISLNIGSHGSESFGPEKFPPSFKGLWKWKCEQNHRLQEFHQMTKNVTTL